MHLQHRPNNLIERIRQMRRSSRISSKYEVAMQPEAESFAWNSWYFNIFWLNIWFILKYQFRRMLSYLPMSDILISCLSLAFVLIWIAIRTDASYVFIVSQRLNTRLKRVLKFLSSDKVKFICHLTYSSSF